jgi:ribonuclease HI
MIFTDGSYHNTKTPTTGGGAVVFKTTETNYHFIKIVKDIHIDSAFDLELAALAIARVASSTANPECIIHSDSQASLQVMENINQREYQKHPLQHIFNQHHLYSSTPCKWVKSHIERRNTNQASWSEAEIGNYIADKMAEHEQHNLLVGPPIQLDIVHPITINPTMAIKLSAILNMFSQYNSFSIRSNTQVITGKLKDIHISDSTTSYLNNRDKYRAKRVGTPPQPYWAVRCPSILKHTNRASTLLRENALRSRIIYDKSWTTGNQFKYGVTDTPEACPCCGQGTETQEHIIFKCNHSAMMTTRAAAWKAILESIVKQKLKHPALSKLIDFFCDLACDTTTTEIWTGLWTNHRLHEIKEKLRHPPYNSQTTIDTVMKLTRLYTDACKDIYIMRHIIIKNPTITVDEAPTERVATTIHSYFTTDNKLKEKKSKTSTTTSAGEQTGMVGKENNNNSTLGEYLTKPTHNNHNTNNNTSHNNNNEHNNNNLPNSRTSDSIITTHTTTYKTATNATSTITIIATTTSSATTMTTKATTTSTTATITTRTDLNRAANERAAEHVIYSITENYITRPCFQKRKPPPLPQLPTLKKTKTLKTRVAKRPLLLRNNTTCHTTNDVYTVDSIIAEPALTSPRKTHIFNATSSQGVLRTAAQTPLPVPTLYTIATLDPGQPPAVRIDPPEPDPETKEVPRDSPDTPFPREVHIPTDPDCTRPIKKFKATTTPQHVSRTTSALPSSNATVTTPSTTAGLVPGQPPAGWPTDPHPVPPAGIEHQEHPDAQFPREGVG